VLVIEDDSLGIIEVVTLLPLCKLQVDTLVSNIGVGDKVDLSVFPHAIALPRGFMRRSGIDSSYLPANEIPDSIACFSFSYKSLEELNRCDVSNVLRLVMEEGLRRLVELTLSSSMLSEEIISITLLEC